MPTETETDICIIGAGPVGLFAVFECGMLGMRCAVVDALDAIGGQCIALYPEKPIYDIPAYPVIDASTLIERLIAQAAPFKPDYRLGRRVETLARDADGRLRLGTSAGDVIVAHAVVIAAGAGAFGPNRPPLEGLESYEGKGVFYAVQKREDFRGKRVVIAGGGDSALDWAVSLAEIAASVAVVHRRAKFRAAPETVSRMEALAREGRITLAVPYQLLALEGSDGVLTGVTVATLKNETLTLEADVLLPFFGLSTELGPIAAWGLGLDRAHVVVDPATCATNIPGVFAIGDIASYPGKLKLILQGFSEAAMAAHAMYAIVHPDTALHFEYSTTRGVPAAA